ncbi:MAG TPA: tetratricopeptide repeat protein [Micromonosporaceae bacterium]|nr:tetratricopeptide repeat protein [Micromonosporaceae bacterium]
MAAFDALAGALRCWRGPVAADGGERLRSHPAAVALARHRVAAASRLADLAVQLGVPEQAVDLLQTVVRDEPLHEGIHARLMVALAASGEQSAAVALFDTLRTRLRDELGIAPGPEVEQAHVRILRQEVPVVLRQPAPAAARRGPAQLPLDVRGFSGRRRELVWLDKTLCIGTGQPTVVTISAILGTAGVGKTALAVHWAHGLADRYPDGQLYVNLRGFDPSGAVMSSADAVRGFLDALGIAPERIPGTVDAQVGLYRSLLGGKRMLVVLDNARDAEQVRPMLPGAPGCLVVVTSRNQMPSLVAVEGAHSLTLDLLTDAEARQLLIRRVGRAAVSEDPDAVDEVIRYCAGLPLALVITAARAMSLPGVSFATLAQELCEAHGGLDTFDGGDAVSNVRAVFSWSYRTLSADAARLFRLLGLHPGPDVSTAAVVSLAALPVEQVRRLLGELTRAHLLTDHAPGRFAFHDLLRVYAVELARSQESEAEQRAVVHRLLDHYLFSAFNATVLLDAHRHRISLSELEPDVQPEDFSEAEQALAWFVAEHAVLVAVIRQAVNAGFDSHVWQLTWTVGTFFDQQGHWREWAAVAESGLAAAQRAGDLEDRARAHRGVAAAYGLLDRRDDAHAHFRRAIELFAEIGDVIGEAHTHRNLAWLLERHGQYEDALHHFERTHDLSQATANPALVAGATNAIGWCQARLGKYEIALTNCRKAYAAFEEAGVRSGMASTADSLGYIHHLLCDHSTSVSWYERAIDMYREAGYREGEAETLERLGERYLEAGDCRAARRVWLQALEIVGELEKPDAGRLAAKLDALATDQDAR